MAGLGSASLCSDSPGILAAEDCVQVHAATLNQGNECGLIAERLDACVWDSSVDWELLVFVRYFTGRRQHYIKKKKSFSSQNFFQLLFPHPATLPTQHNHMKSTAACTTTLMTELLQLISASIKTQQCVQATTKPSVWPPSGKILGSLSFKRGNVVLDFSLNPQEWSLLVQAGC